jgi:hypothetical protein
VSQQLSDGDSCFVGGYARQEPTNRVAQLDLIVRRKREDRGGGVLFRKGREIKDGASVDSPMRRTVGKSKSSLEKNRAALRDQQLTGKPESSGVLYVGIETGRGIRPRRRWGSPRMACE